MAGDAVVGFEVWMEVIALDVESDGLQMLLEVTGAVIQLLAVTGSYWQLLGSSCKMVCYYWHLLLAVIQLLAVIRLLAVTGSYWAVLVRWYLTTGIYNYWQ